MRVQQLLVPCLLVFSIACGKSEEQRQAEAAVKSVEPGAQAARGAAAGSQQMTQGPRQMAQGPRQMTQNAAPTVDFELLKALIPDVDGWTKSDVRGEEITGPVSHSRAQARYRRNEGRVELEIVDTALSQLLLAPLSVFLASGYAERSDDGFKRAVRISGQPGMEDWSSTSSRGEVTALVANRFVVKATGHDIDAIDPVRKVVEAVDFSSLATIK